MVHRERSLFAPRSLVAGIMTLGLAAVVPADEAVVVADASSFVDPPQPPTVAGKFPPAGLPPAGSQPPAVRSHKSEHAKSSANQNSVALAPSPANPFTSGSPSYSLASIPNMLGDVLGAKRFFYIGGNVSLAGGDRAAKIADDSRPLPTVEFSSTTTTSPKRTSPPTMP